MVIEIAIPTPVNDSVPALGRGHCTIINKVVNDNADSFESGSSAKGGKIKVYGNYSNITEFKKKIQEAIELRKWANAQIEINNV